MNIMENMQEVQRPATSTYPKVAIQWLNQALCFYQSFCLVDSEVLRNRHLRVAAKRCVQHIFRTYAESFSPIFFRKKFIEIVTEKSCVIIENGTELCR